jgi:hypothetical protein
MWKSKIFFAESPGMPVHENPVYNDSDLLWLAKIHCYQIVEGDVSF